MCKGEIPYKTKTKTTAKKKENQLTKASLQCLDGLARPFNRLQAVREAVCCYSHPSSSAVSSSHSRWPTSFIVTQTTRSEPIGSFQANQQVGQNFPFRKNPIKSAALPRFGLCYKLEKYTPPSKRKSSSTTLTLNGLSITADLKAT